MNKYNLQRLFHIGINATVKYESVLDLDYFFYYVRNLQIILKIKEKKTYFYKMKVCLIFPSNKMRFKIKLTEKRIDVKNFF